MLARSWPGPALRLLADHTGGRNWRCWALGFIDRVGGQSCPPQLTRFKSSVDTLSTPRGEAGWGSGFEGSRQRWSKTDTGIIQWSTPSNGKPAGSFIREACYCKSSSFSAPADTVAIKQTGQQAVVGGRDCRVPVAIPVILKFFFSLLSRCGIREGVILAQWHYTNTNTFVLEIICLRNIF